MSRRGQRRGRPIRERLNAALLADPESYGKATALVADEMLRRAENISDMEPEHSRAFLEGIKRSGQAGLAHPEILKEKLRPGLVLVRVLCGACSRLVMVVETHGDKLSAPLWFRACYGRRYDLLSHVPLPLPLIRVSCPEHGERSTPLSLLSSALRKSLRRIEPNADLDTDPESMDELLLAIARSGKSAPVTTRALPRDLV